MEGGLQRRLQPVDHFLALSPLLPDQRCELLVVISFEELEREILQFCLHTRHSKPVSERCVDLAGLEGNALLTLFVQVLQRPHVV